MDKTFYSFFFCQISSVVHLCHISSPVRSFIQGKKKPNHNFGKRILFGFLRESKKKRRNFKNFHSSPKENFFRNFFEKSSQKSFRRRRKISIKLFFASNHILQNFLKMNISQFFEFLSA